MDLSLYTSFPPSPSTSPRSDISTTTTSSPLSSTATSPTSLPTSPSPFRRFCRAPWSSLHHKDIATGNNHTGVGVHGLEYDASSRSRSQSPLRLPASTTISGRRGRGRLSSLFWLLRRRPSRAELALSEERTRCDGDAIERKGLGLLEPRPVDPVVDAVDEIDCGRPGIPRFVMGGIEEVMEGG